MATNIQVTFAKEATLPQNPTEGRLEVVDESATATEVEAYVGTQNNWKKITDKNKANPTGYYEGMTVGYADNLTPYSEDSGTTQTQPFFLEGTATGNGESRVDAKQVPAFAFLQEKRGNMVCVNQLVQNGDFSNGMTGWTLAVGTSSISGGVCTITSTGGNTYMYQSVSQKVTGHKVLLMITAYASVNQSMWVNWGDSLGTVALTTSKQTFLVVATVGSGNTNLNFTFPSAVSGENIYLSNIRLADLTQWFNGNIPTYLLSHPEAFGRYYKGPLTYEPGRLEPATGRYLTSVGRNIWDEEWESGGISPTGVLEPSATTIRSKNYINVSSSTAYYCKTSGTVGARYFDNNGVCIGTANISNTDFVVPSNCSKMKFVVLNTTTYNHDITISEYYSGESGYDKHYPYEVLATIDTGNEDLGAFDVKYPNGLIGRNSGEYTITGQESYVFHTNEESTYSKHYGVSITCPIAPNDNTKRQDGAAVISKIFVYKYVNSDKCCYFGTVVGSSININFINDSATTAEQALSAITGITIQYQLAEPTTEQGTPFQENIPIDDFGQLSWSNTDVPQGNQIFYPVDYKAYLDSLVNHTNGDPTSVVVEDDITDTALNARGYYKMEDLSSGITDLLSGITVITKKLTKQGNVVTLSFVGQNDTGSAITANTALFKLPSGAYDTNYNVLSPCVANSQVVFFRILYNASGSLNLNGDWAKGTTLFINASFVV